MSDDTPSALLGTSTFDEIRGAGRICCLVYKHRFTAREGDGRLERLGERQEISD